MNKPKSLDQIFKEKIFRIPDFQRGYAWQLPQLRAFWEDLVNLPNSRSHYTGVLTLVGLHDNYTTENRKEFWLIDDHSYQMYHVVDGQQRLTTFVILLQAFVECVQDLAENEGKAASEIYVSDSLSVEDIRQKYLFKVKPTGDKFRTYKFGYEEDNPSDQYLRYKILLEDGQGTVAETFYTLNLSNAKTYFATQVSDYHSQFGMEGLREVYRKLTKRLLFNEYIMQDEFDVFVAFETMNNRGKSLSNLELLKNRLIYLTTLFEDSDLDPSERNSLRGTINDAWKEVYHQLGRNKKNPLNDDDFLKAHWVMYFMYTRAQAKAYVKFLLEQEFSPHRIHKMTDSEVALEEITEQTEDGDDSDDDEIVEASANCKSLKAIEISSYVTSLKESSVHWFNSFYPHFSQAISDEEAAWIDRLNRIGMIYFRPLVMAIMKNEPSSKRRCKTFQKIERFLFVAMQLTLSRSSYGNTEFYNAARELEYGEITIDDIDAQIDDRLAFAFEDDETTIVTADLINIIRKKYEQGSGWYGWKALKYFLFEYEVSLLKESRQKKVEWTDLLKTPKDRISIEHIYPQTETEYWRERFDCCGCDENKHSYKGSLGNLLLLSSAINSSLQNDSFPDKKQVKRDSKGKIIRHGYSNGSHSEIEIAAHESWGTGEIHDRGMRLLEFMENRWQFKFADENAKIEVLNLDIEGPDPEDPWD